jgi:hypothetical protein
MSAAVVKLPTAAPHKVNNGRWAQQRRAGMAMREQQGAFDFPLHHDRAAVIKAERLADFMEANLPLRAEMAVILGLVQVLNPDQVERLVSHVMASKDALTLVELARADMLTKHLIWVVMQRRGLV